MALGQAAGAAASLVCQSSRPLPVQDVSYPLLRARLAQGEAILHKPDPFSDLLRRMDQKLERLAATA